MSDMNEKKSTFSLVTTCWNEISSVENWIRDVKQQSVQPLEILIVDAQSSDGTLECLKKWQAEDSRVQVIVSKGCNVAQGRNLAISKARTTHIVSTDMGCRLDSRWFEGLVKPFGNGEDIDVVAGNYAAEMSTVCTPAARSAYYLANKYKTSLVDGFLPSSRSIAFKKSVWEEIDGYAEDLSLAADDTVFAMQLYSKRKRIAFAPEAMCLWRRHRELKKYWREAFVYARGHGEAGIEPPAGMTVYQETYSILGCHIRAGFQSVLHIKRAALQAIRRMDFSALVMLPVLKYGLTVNLYKGYSVGVKRGVVHCQGCRKRIGVTGCAQLD